MKRARVRGEPITGDCPYHNGLPKHSAHRPISAREGSCRVGSGVGIVVGAEQVVGRSYRAGVSLPLVCDADLTSTSVTRFMAVWGETQKAWYRAR